MDGKAQYHIWAEQTDSPEEVKRKNDGRHRCHCEVLGCDTMLWKVADWQLEPPELEMWFVLRNCIFSPFTLSLLLIPFVFICVCVCVYLGGDGHRAPGRTEDWFWVQEAVWSGLAGFAAALSVERPSHGSGEFLIQLFCPPPARTHKKWLSLSLLTQWSILTDLSGKREHTVRDKQ